MYKIPHLDLPPLRGAAGTVRLPGSKSISNRVLLLAGLSEGTTLVRDLLASDDTQVMLAALKALGCGLQPQADGALAVTGLGGRLAVHQAALFLGNAGTAMRPLAAALAVLAALQGGRFELSGVPRMHERPIADLVDALRQLGCTIDYLGAAGYPPLAVQGAARAAADNTLQIQREIRVRGDVSSQFLTALLLALPLATTAGPVVIAVDGELISKPYVEITLNLLARFGIAVERQGFERFDAHPRGVGAANDGTHAGAHHQIGPQAVRVQNPQHTQVRQAAQAPARQHQRHARRALQLGRLRLVVQRQRARRRRRAAAEQGQHQSPGPSPEPTEAAGGGCFHQRSSGLAAVRGGVTRKTRLMPPSASRLTTLAASRRSAPETKTGALAGRLWAACMP